MQDKMKKIPELDGIRGLAILLVCVWHYFNCQLSTSSVFPAFGKLAIGTSWCWSGVDLFFVLSGFLIGGIIIDNRDSSNFLKVFFIRRVLRIFPVYCLLLLAFFSLRCVLDPVRFAWLFAGNMPDVSYLTFTQNIWMGLSRQFGGNFLGVTWSLAVEEQFYLIIPFMCLAFSRKYWLPIALFLSLLAPILRLSFPGFHARVLTAFRMDALFLGCLAAGVVRNRRINEYLTEHKWILRCIFLALAIPLGVIVSQGLGQMGNQALFACLYAVLVLLTVVESGSSSVSILRSPILRFFGLISYGLYLFHQPVAGVLHGIILGSRPSLNSVAAWILTLLSFGISVLLAGTSYFLIERKLLRLGRSQSYENSQCRVGARIVRSDVTSVSQ
jgi:peptidoglycan/LPS O-acetylase OafA/YrhL